jgi:CheY-like chemotaxis protein
MERRMTHEGGGGAAAERRRPRVLCVDDEPAVLDGLRLHLRRSFDVVTAADGLEGLQRLEQGPAFAAILSDMRMPGMDGATFLARARARSPDTVRILLTGHADLDAALAAVNEGQIFRFLTKPCSPDYVRATLEQAAEQHRLVVAERELLDQTLTGAVKALTDLLAIADPVAFGRASRLRRTVSALCAALALPDRWAIEVAAELSQVGLVSLAPGVAGRLLRGEALPAAEQAQIERAAHLGAQLLDSIPRLAPVRAILEAVARGWPGGGPVAADAPAGAAMLALALELDTLEVQGHAPMEAIAVLESRPTHPVALVGTLRGIVEAWTASSIREIRLEELRAGMVLAEDVWSRSGVLLLARGHTASAGILARLQNIGATVREPLRIVVADR